MSRRVIDDGFLNQFRRAVMAEHGQIKINVQVAASPLGDCLRGLRDAFTSVNDAARRAAQALAPLIRCAPQGSRRRRPRRPCAWCADAFKLPATHVTKWRQVVVFEPEVPDDGRVCWEAGRRLLMCQRHAQRAARYPGVAAYRFRRVAS